MDRLRLVAFVVVVAWAGVDRAVASPQSWSLGRVVVVGAKRIPAATVVGMTGLKPGTFVKATDVERAGQRLVDSGLFASVGHRYDMVGYSLTVTFSVEEPPWDTRFLFDNFVWFTDEELVRAVTRVLPGFAGFGPTLPRTLQRVTNALEAEVERKGIQGSVSYTMGGASGTNSYLFKVDVPKGMPICAVDLDGVAPERLHGARARVALLLGQDYSRDFVERVVGTNVLPFFGQRGYLKAAPGRLQVKLAATESCNAGVTVLVPISEGRQYTWSGTTWVGADGVFSPADLDRWLGVERGAVADTQRLEEGLEAVRDRFVGQGYVATRTASATECDDGAGTAVASITVTHGPRVKLRAFAILGLPEELAGQLKAEWAHPPNEYFNGLYVNEYLAAVRTKYPEVIRAFPTITVDTMPVTGAIATVDVTLKFAVR